MNCIRRTRHGLMIYNNSDIWAGKSYDHYGEFMEAEMMLTSFVLRAGDVALDVGAGIGTHAVPMARMVGDEGRVFAFEPERRSFNMLCGNVALNEVGNVYCYHEAIGNRVGATKVPEIDVKATINFGGVELFREYEDCPSYLVPIMTLDQHDFQRCDFIKVDVEGMEADVLKGARKLIAERKPYVYFESEDRTRSECVAIMKSLGYTLFLQNAPLFQSENFFANATDVFVNEQGLHFVTAMILCVPEGRKLGFNPLENGLTEV